METVLLYEEH